MGISEKTSYLKGLLEGLDIDKTKPEGKLIDAIIDTLDEMAQEVNGLRDDLDGMAECVDEIDYDLGEVETEVYGLDDYDDDDDYEYGDEEFDPACVDCDAENCDGCAHLSELEEND